MNGTALGAFRMALGRLWRRTSQRRSQRHRITWERMIRLAERWLPPVRIRHPYPHQRLGVATRGKSRMR